MNKVILGGVGTGAIIVGGIAALIYSGAYNVAASEPHWSPTIRLLEVARRQSVRAHAATIQPPADLGESERVVAGTAHYAEHCATCHAGPGVEADDMAEGMYPKPPALTDVSKRFSPGELFWILKNGIKMTGMPAWGDHSDDELWSMVAFLDQLPGMTPEAYRDLRAAAEAAGGHHRHGTMPDAGEDKDEHHD